MLCVAAASSTIIPLEERHLYHPNRTTNALGSGRGAASSSSASASAPAPSTLLSSSSTALPTTAGSGSGSGGARHTGGKELLREWIAHKKNLFRFKTSIETKRQEIQKLKSEFVAREQAVAKAAEMLDADFSLYVLFWLFVWLCDGKRRESAHIKG